MELLRQQVTHAKYGAGTVTGLNANVLRVFFDQSGSRAFRYPDIFYSELKLADSDRQKKLEEELDGE